MDNFLKFVEKVKENGLVKKNQQPVAQRRAFDFVGEESYRGILEEARVLGDRARGEKGNAIGAIPATAEKRLDAHQKGLKIQNAAIGFLKKIDPPPPPSLRR